jgi:hypothetical protein
MDYDSRSPPLEPLLPTFPYIWRICHPPYHDDLGDSRRCMHPATTADLSRPLTPQQTPRTFLRGHSS